MPARLTCRHGTLHCCPRCTAPDSSPAWPATWQPGGCSGGWAGSLGGGATGGSTTDLQDDPVPVLRCHFQSALCYHLLTLQTRIYNHDTIITQTVVHMIIIILHTLPHTPSHAHPPHLSQRDVVEVAVVQREAELPPHSFHVLERVHAGTQHKEDGRGGASLLVGYLKWNGALLNVLGAKLLLYIQPGEWGNGGMGELECNEYSTMTQNVNQGTCIWSGELAV